MSAGCPDYVSRSLAEGEEVVCFIPVPDRRARLSLQLKTAPLFGAAFFALLSLNVSGKGGIYGALVGWACIGGIVGLFIYELRLCRTSYAVTSLRVLRFISERVTEQLNLADSTAPEVLSFARSPSVLLRAWTRVLRLSPIILVPRKAPLSLTFRRFLSNSDLKAMHLGAPIIGFPTEEIFPRLTSAWRAAQ